MVQTEKLNLKQDETTSLPSDMGKMKKSTPTITQIYFK